MLLVVELCCPLVDISVMLDLCDRCVWLTGWSASSSEPYISTRWEHWSNSEIFMGNHGTSSPSEATQQQRETQLPVRNRRLGKVWRLTGALYDYHHSYRDVIGLSSWCHRVVIKMSPCVSDLVHCLLSLVSDVNRKQLHTGDTQMCDVRGVQVCVPASAAHTCAGVLKETMLTWSLRSCSSSLNSFLLQLQSAKISTSLTRRRDARDSMCFRFTRFSCSRRRTEEEKEERRREERKERRKKERGEKREEREGERREKRGERRREERPEDWMWLWSSLTRESETGNRK